MSKPQLNAICEILINIQYGNVPVSDAVKKKLQRKKNIIQELTSKSTGPKLRKTLIEKEVVLIVYCCQVNTSTSESNSIMATEFILIPKHKYAQLEKDAAPKDGSVSSTTSSPPSDDTPHTTNNNDNQPDLSHDDQLGPDDSNTDDDNDDYDAPDVLESFNSTELKYVQPHHNINGK